MKELVERKLAHNIKSAKKMVEKLQPEVWDVLEDVIKSNISRRYAGYVKPCTDTA